MTLVIALDARGGAAPPALGVGGAGRALRRQRDLRFRMCAARQRIDPLLAADTTLAGRVELVHTPDFVASDAKPSQAVR